MHIHTAANLFAAKLLAAQREHGAVISRVEFHGLLEEAA